MQKVLGKILRCHTCAFILAENAKESVVQGTVLRILTYVWLRYYNSNNGRQGEVLLLH